MRSMPLHVNAPAAHGAESAVSSPGSSNPWRVLGLVAVGTFMTTLDSSIVSISLPALARDFGTPLSGAIEWVIVAYLVTIAALLLTFGRLSNVIGFVVGVAR